MSLPCAIAPSILSFPHADLRPYVRDMMFGGAGWIHIDVMDGQFVPPITFGDGLVRSLQGLGDVPFEAHLMTLTPQHQFEAFAEAGCKRIIFHQEATYHAHRLAQQLRECGIEAGIAINPATPAEAVRPMLEAVDMVLVMTVNPGWGGQALIRACFDKVRQIRAWAPDMPIEVDGGIDPKTLPAAREAGANLFVVGSWLQKQPSVLEGMKVLTELCE